jgi:hypothetical protein
MSHSRGNDSSNTVASAARGVSGLQPFSAAKVKQNAAAGVEKGNTNLD